MAVGTNQVETRADRFHVRLVRIDLNNGITPNMCAMDRLQTVRSDIRALEIYAAQAMVIADSCTLPGHIKRVARFNATLKLGQAARLKRSLEDY